MGASPGGAMPRLCLLLLSLLIASSGSAVTMDWTPIGDPGNACDQQFNGCYGAVNYTYSIGTYEVTNAQYAEFLNAVAATDTNGLYNTGMASNVGGIARSGVSGSYSYSTIFGRSDWPVNFVSVVDTVRFVNWLQNGQPTGQQGVNTTESGTYAFTSQTVFSARNPVATIVLPTENEWYKAAYYHSTTQAYFDYPAGTNATITCSNPTAAPNSANCSAAPPGTSPRQPAFVGAYSGSASPYGTFDRGGNLWEYNETLVDPRGFRGARGGAFNDSPNGGPSAAIRGSSGNVDFDQALLSFRVGSTIIPEPSTGLLVVAGLLGFGGRRRRG